MHICQHYIEFRTSQFLANTIYHLICHINQEDSMQSQHLWQLTRSCFSHQSLSLNESSCACSVKSFSVPVTNKLEELYLDWFYYHVDSTNLHIQDTTYNILLPAVKEVIVLLFLNVVTIFIHIYGVKDFIVQYMSLKYEVMIIQ